MKQSQEIRTRFAPSPTGYLHVGGARTALFNYLFARARGGKFIIRVEDTDQERSDPQSEQMILESLAWLGIRADEGPSEGGPFAPYRQSERLDVFAGYTDQLVKAGQAYPCFCSDEELKLKQEQAKKMGLPYVYDGKCRGLSDEEISRRKADGEAFTIRFRVESGEVVVEDVVQGRVKFDARLIGDFIIVKSNGFPSYNFAVVCDDQEMQITHVIRGVGHLSNTPRQVLIQDALGLERPVYAHISEIVGTDKKKLSKRRGATSILFFRDLGYLSEAFVNYMSLLGWYPRDAVEYMSTDELAKKFDLAQCSKSPAMFDFFLTDREGAEDFDPASLDPAELQRRINKKSKLNWLNNRHIRDLPLDDLIERVRPFLSDAADIRELIEKEPDRVRQAIGSVRIYVDTLQDFVAYLREVFKVSVQPESDEARAVLEDESARGVVVEFVSLVADRKPETPDEFAEAMKEAGRRASVKGRALFMPIRVASTGSAQGLELPTLFSILGYAAVEERMRRAL